MHAATATEHPSDSPRADARRAQIRAAAAECFRQHGFHGSSIAQISKRAGMSTGHIYHYFENKEAIIVEIVAQDLARVLTLTAELRSARDLKDAMIARVAEGVAEHTDANAAALRLEIAAEAARSPAIAEIAKQVGEYLVAAELGRLGLIAAPFSGSIPDYDIIATNSAFSSVLVQVKAITGTSRQFDIRRFVDAQLHGKKQVAGRRVPLANDIVCVMVALSGYGSDRFYVLPLKKLQDLLIKGHRQYLAKHGGVRPKKYDSFHTAIRELELAPFKDGWLAEFRDKRGLHVTDPGA